MNESPAFYFAARQMEQVVLIHRGQWKPRVLGV